MVEAAQENGVKVGLSEFKFAVLNGTEKIVSNDAITRVRGLKTAKQTVTADSEIFYADDGAYAVLDSGITEMKLEVEVADLVSKVKEALLGITLEKGIEIYGKDLAAPYVACSFKTKLSTGKYVYFGLLKGKFGLPSFDGKTKEDKMEAQTDTIEGNFVARDDGNIFVIGREDNADFTLDGFMAKVYPGYTPG